MVSVVLCCYLEWILKIHCTFFTTGTVIAVIYLRNPNQLSWYKATGLRLLPGFALRSNVVRDRQVTLSKPDGMETSLRMSRRTGFGCVVWYSVTLSLTLHLSTLCTEVHGTGMHGNGRATWATSVSSLRSRIQKSPARGRQLSLRGGMGDVSVPYAIQLEGLGPPHFCTFFVSSLCFRC